jgi:hypothetical protein
MVGEHEGEHRLGDGNAADGDARVVPPLGHHLDLGAVHVHRRLRRRDRAGRLDGEAHDHVLSRGNPAEHAAGVVGEETDGIALHAHGVVVLLARHGGGGEAVADFHPLDRRDRQHRLGDVGIQAIEGRCAEAGGHPGRHHLDDAPGRRCGLAHAIEKAFPRQPPQSDPDTRTDCLPSPTSPSGSGRCGVVPSAPGHRAP